MSYYKTRMIIMLLGLSSILSAAAAAEKKPLSINTDSSCITASCHAAMATKKSIHPVAAEGSSCVLCHIPREKEKHLFQPFPAALESLCYQCHENKAAGKHIHSPVSEGQCLFCHDPHQSDHAKLLITPLPELCFMCHDAGAFQGKSSHGPVADGACTGCHNPHSSDNERLLIAQAPDLCFTCHAAQVKDPQGRMLPATKYLFDDKESTFHPPFAAGMCGICHLPHASAAPRLLTAEYPAGFYACYSEASFRLCLTCHSGKAFTEPRTLTDTEFRNGNLNLHYRHVNKSKGRTCGACHDPHGSRQPKLIRRAFPFGKRILPLTYEKTDTGGSCATACHGRVKYDRCEPEDITLRTTPRKGEDASGEALRNACEQQKK